MRELFWGAAQVAGHAYRRFVTFQENVGVNLQLKPQVERYCGLPRIQPKSLKTEFSCILDQMFQNGATVPLALKRRVCCEFSQPDVAFICKKGCGTYQGFVYEASKM